MSVSRHLWLRALLFFVLAVLGGAAAVFLFPQTGLAPGPAPTPPPPAPKAPLPAPAALGSGKATIADVVQQVLPSVVNIVSTLESPHRVPFHPFLGPGGRGPAPQGVGSGVIVRKDGIVLTNNHVVSQARSIRVILSDHRELDAEVVGTDPPTDVAVLRLADEPKGLRALPFGDSGRLRLGDVVLAIGNPFGVGQTVTMGIVSATGRANVGIVDYEDFIQTDAAINPGNSGGALVDMEGRLVGINTAILSRTGGNQGIGFAIPSNMARTVMQSLLDRGRVVRGWLGVAIQDVDSRLAKALGLPTSEGVVVADVVDGSPAAEAGIERGDLILKLDGEDVLSTGQLRNAIALAGQGTKVALDLLRDGDRRRVEAVLKELPRDLLPDAPAPPPSLPPSSMGGMTLAPLDADTRRQFEIPKAVRDGVVVLEVEPASSAADAGIHPGDVIVEVDREPVGTVEDLARRIGHAASQVLLRIQRGRSAFFAVLEP